MSQTQTEDGRQTGTTRYEIVRDNGDGARNIDEEGIRSQMDGHRVKIKPRVEKSQKEGS